MNLGFKVAPPAPPKVLAAGTEATCGESPREKGKGIYCERSKGHDGGHLSQSRGRYWPAGEES